MKRLIILAATLIAGLSACDSLLDKEPLDRVTQFDYFKTRSDLELFSNPFYDNLLDKTPYDEQNDLLVQMTLSDVLYGGDKRTVPNTGGGWSWGNLRRINTLLEYVDQCEDKKAVTEYTALAKFFRAAFYFDKVKRFGDVPWYEVQLGSADEALYKPRDSRELIMTNMIKDIDEAINSGGLTEDISTYRVNKWAALALKARFCLFEGTYRKYHGINLEGHDYTYYLEEAAKAAKTIIDEGPYKLYSTKNPDKDYMMLFAQENASTEEYILAIRNSYEAQVYHNATAYTLLPTQGRPGYTRKFINMYLMKDGKAFTDKFKTEWQTMPFTEEVKDRDPRLAQSIRTPGYKRIGAKRVQGPDLGVTITGYQPIKFVQDTTASGGQIDRNDRSTCDMPVFRYAEVLLNYAEAKAELGTLTQNDLAITVNEIRLVSFVRGVRLSQCDRLQRNRKRHSGNPPRTNRRADPGGFPPSGSVSLESRLLHRPGHFRHVFPGPRRIQACGQRNGRSDSLCGRKHQTPGRRRSFGIRTRFGHHPLRGEQRLCLLSQNRRESAPWVQRGTRLPLPDSQRRAFAQPEPHAESGMERRTRFLSRK